jgi:Domain of unknown function (DUF1854)
MSISENATNAPHAMAAQAAAQFDLVRAPSGRLLLTDAEARTHDGVVPVRAFPLAAPDEGLSLVSADGHELGWIEDIAALPAALQQLLQEELALRDFVPEITRLVSVSTFGTPSVWTVETDRGPTSFVLKGEEDIRRLSASALLIAGGQGVQYGVRDMGALDRASRKLLERFL